MKHLIVSAVLCTIGTGGALYAQEKCKTVEILEQKIAENPAIQDEINAINSFTENWISTEYQQFKEQKAVLTLPVVVHVVWNSSAENISDAQIQSQIDVLNEDFRKLNSNSSNTAAPFQSIAADCEIEFCLATTDPQGNPTNGVTRTQTNSSAIGNSNNWYSTANGGHDPWDNTKYINIWVCQIGQGILGFATPPTGPNPGPSDGMVISPQYFGNTGTATGSIPNHLGRTATHEMGHYLNLHHVWGPTNGGCGEDDFISDTPSQESSNFGCPSFPHTDACTSSGNGVNFQNYMDYTDDNCMTMFTEGQKARMIAALNGPRASLLSSNGCAGSNAGINTNEISLDLLVYPNPAKNSITISIENSTNQSYEFELRDLTGKVLSTYNVVQDLTFSTRELPDGIYFLIAPDSPSFSKKIIIQK